jgi:hypothetical protein|tara:strand:+ start:343 stop:1416 length:1074 start_codon:yes stop_codon:yes gene_type:complete
MFIFFLNINKKTIYIIFTLIFLSIISLDHSLSSNHILAVEELEISKEIDLKFSRNKLIDDAFRKAFYRLLSQILNSSDIKKLKNVNMREIKTLVENFKIKNEIFRDNKYNANFDVYFNKDKIKFFLEKKNLFYSNPKQISVLFLPIIIEQKKLYLFNENIFYKYWLTNKDQSGLINYIMPLEDIDEITKLTSSQENLENLDIIEIAKKYNTENYILCLIYLEKKKLNLFSKIKFEEYKKNSNLIFQDVDIKNEDSIASIISKAKVHLNDIWKDFNEINTSIKLSINLILYSNDTDKISKFENTLTKIDDIGSFSIKKFDLNKTVYEIIYNTDPNKLIKQFSIYGFEIVNDENRWIIR